MLRTMTISTKRTNAVLFTRQVWNLASTWPRRVTVIDIVLFLKIFSVSSRVSFNDIRSPLYTEYISALNFKSTLKILNKRKLKEQHLTEH